METSNQNDFETVATNAEQKLERVSSVIDKAMKEMPTKEYDELVKKMEIKLHRVASGLTVELIENETWWMHASEKNLFRDFQNLFSPLLSEIPPEFAGKLVRKLLMSERWNQRFELAPYPAAQALSFVVAFLGNGYGGKTKSGGFDATLANISSFLPWKKEESNGGKTPPLSIVFDKNDFRDTPQHFGAGLPENMEITFSGNVGNYTGNQMNGGKLTILGNSGDYTAKQMKKGTLTICGNSGKGTAKQMIGGKLVIEGDVETFSATAFEKNNKGTIVWKGVTILDDGWTPEGLEMKKAGKIPFIDDR